MTIGKSERKKRGMNVSIHCIGLCLSRCGTCIPEDHKRNRPPVILCIFCLWFWLNLCCWSSRKSQKRSEQNSVALLSGQSYSCVVEMGCSSYFTGGLLSCTPMVLFHCGCSRSLVSSELWLSKSISFLNVGKQYCGSFEEYKPMWDALLKWCLCFSGILVYLCQDDCNSWFADYC